MQPTEAPFAFQQIEGRPQSNANDSKMTCDRRACNKDAADEKHGLCSHIHVYKDDKQRQMIHDTDRYGTHPRGRSAKVRCVYIRRREVPIKNIKSNKIIYVIRGHAARAFLISFLVARWLVTTPEDWPKTSLKLVLARYDGDDDCLQGRVRNRKGPRNG